MQNQLEENVKPKCIFLAGIFILTAFLPAKPLQQAYKDAVPGMGYNRLILKPNFPNPFNSSTIFNVELAAAGDVEIRLYDLAGREIYNRKMFSLNKGTYYLQWDGYTDYMEPAASGFYFLQIIFESPAGAKLAKSAKIQLIR